MREEAERPAAAAPPAAARAAALGARAAREVRQRVRAAGVRAHDRRAEGEHRDRLARLELAEQPPEEPRVAPLAAAHRALNQMLWHVPAVPAGVIARRIGAGRARCAGARARRRLAVLLPGVVPEAR
eukprot:3428129-Prymnesium_polylepis.1